MDQVFLKISARRKKESVGKWTGIAHLQKICSHLVEERILLQTEGLFLESYYCQRCGVLPSFENPAKLDGHRRLSKTGFHACFLQICADGAVILRRSTALTNGTCLLPTKWQSQCLVWGMVLIQCLLLVRGWEEMSSEISSVCTGGERRGGRKKHRVA